LEESIESYLKNDNTYYVKNVNVDKYIKPYECFLSYLYLKIGNYTSSEKPTLVTKFVNKYIANRFNELSIKILKWCDKNDINVLGINRERFKQLDKGESMSKKQNSNDVSTWKSYRRQLEETVHSMVSGYGMSEVLLSDVTPVKPYDIFLDRYYKRRES